MELDSSSLLVNNQDSVKEKINEIVDAFEGLKEQ